MKFIPMREPKINPSKVLDEDLLDDFIIAHHPTLMKELEEARQEYLEKGGVDHETMKRMIERGH